MALFKDFTKRGPTITPVDSLVPWNDTRPSPKSVVHGVYTATLYVGPDKNCDRLCPPFLNPRKPRDTV